MRSRFLLAGVLGFSTVVVACTGLLGDFDVSSATPVATDGGATEQDGGLDGASSPDAAPDGATPLPMLRCQPTAGPARVDTTQGGASFIPPIRAFRSSSQTRIVAVKRGVPGFTLYTLGNGPSGGVQITVVPSSAVTPFPGTVEDVQPIPGGLGVLVWEPTRFVIYKFADGSSTPSQDPVALGLPGGVVPTSATFTAFGQDDFFVQATYVEGGTGTIRAARRKQGATSPALVVVATGAAAGGESRIKSVVRAGSFAFLFNDKGPEQGAAGAAGYYVVPDDPIAGGSAPLIALTKRVDRPIASFAAGPSPAGIRLAVGEVDFQGGTARMLVGNLGPAELNPADVGKLNDAYKLSTFFDAPVQGGDPRWVNSDFVAVGAPVSGGGLNLFWYDAAAASMRVALVGAQRIVPERTATYSTLAPRSLVGGLGDFDVVWSEAPDAQGVATLFTQQIVCAR